MSTSEFDKYKVDHLFLLIGENPLPNYVAARLLLNQGGTLYLVHTTHTAKSATHLAKILGDELIGLKKAELVSLNKYESDAFHIQKEISDKLKTIANGTIGLNYTGGTKAMAVHAYRTIFGKDRPDAIFSYLDPRRLEMCIDRENAERIHLKVTPKLLQLKLAKLFQIHEWTWLEQSEPIDTPELPEAATVFAEFHTNGDLVQLWRDWCNEVLRSAARDGNRWKRETRLQELPALSLEHLNYHEKIMIALKHLGAVGEKLLLQAVKDRGLKDLGAVCKWLDGEWLEHHVLRQVQEISEDLSIYDSATSFWIRNPIDPNNTKFQFDVAFIRGYQLFAISCTTISWKSDCKSKLFEAYIRARQLGGDEARVALVCCASHNDVNALETEIVNVFNPAPDSGKRDHKIAVFGRDDLMDLSSKIEEWIKQNDREAR